MRPRILLIALAVLALGALLATSVSAAPPAQIGCPNNLLQNPGFEEGSHKTESIGTSLSSAVADGWTPWLLRGNERDNREPEYKLEDTNLSKTRFRANSGRYSQKWFTSWGTHDAGVYQQVQVAPGTPLTFSSWAQVYSGEADGWTGEVFVSDPAQPGKYRVYVGIDPTGATPAGVGAPPPDTVIWSEPSLKTDVWHQLAVSAVSQGPAVTVYFKGQPEFSVKHNDSFWDDACLFVDPALTAKPGAPPPPVTLPGTASTQAPVARPAGAGADFAISNGRFFTQTGAGQGGFAVVDDPQARFWTEFQRLGGVDTVGYPISQRYERDSFLTQAFQKLILQWRPDTGTVAVVNVFDEMSKAGLDPALLQKYQTPKPLANFDPTNATWAQIVSGRQALLDANPAIKARYFSVADPLTVFGLPVSKVEDMGNHYALRTQRAVFQQWKEDMPFAKAGEVTIANGGDIATSLGWLGGSPLTPTQLQ